MRESFSLRQMPVNKNKKNDKIRKTAILQFQDKIDSGKGHQGMPKILGERLLEKNTAKHHPIDC